MYVHHNTPSSDGNVGSACLVPIALEMSLRLTVPSHTVIHFAGGFKPTQAVGFARFLRVESRKLMDGRW